MNKTSALVRMAGVLAAAWFAVAMPLSAQAQTGTVTGRVVSAESGAGMATVQISLQGSGLGGLSTQDGTFTLANVPPGTYTIIAQRIGFQRLERAGVTVTAGATTTVNLQMAQQVLAIQGIVAAGLVDPVEGVRSPISVARVGREQMPVVAGSGAAVENLQGMVAGLAIASSSGEPGGGVYMNMRSPTSVMSGSFPLIVVDGVILGTSSVNIESMDIESMEVVKGAAAASLYGSRAAAGVIVITTNRGQGLDLGQTRFQLRAETGISRMHDGITRNQYHPYFMNAERTQYVDAQGNVVPRSRRVAPPAHLQFADKPYPTEVFDNFRSMFAGGGFQSQNFSMMQNAESTNFAVTVNRMHEQGTLQGNDGYLRNSFRVNLDHRFLDNFNLGVSSFHSRDFLDIPKVDFFSLVSAPPDVDVRKKDENGNYIQIPDANVPFENPLWRESSRDHDRHKVRTLSSANLRWEPVSWMSFMSNVSYDREDSQERLYVPKGTPLSVTQVLPSDGQLSYTNQLTDTWNAEAQTSFRRDFGLLNMRTTVRGLLERSKMERAIAAGENFRVQGVPRLDAAATMRSSSLLEDVRALGYLWDTAFDYDAKYILTGLIRRDGSSLFGPDNRWHNYYRLAGAWRLAEEDWFEIPHVDEFKISVARGTAGGRPRFSNQYETWTVTGSGVSKGFLGNSNLAPEHTTETEFSLNAILFGRVGVDVTQAWQRTTDQIVTTNIPSYTGFAFQWVNGGAVEGYTTEVSVEAQIIQRQDFGWTTNFVFDRSDATMVEWPGPCLRPSHRVWCAGENMYRVYGTRFVDNLNALDPNHPHSPHHGGRAWAHRDQFQLNDEGWLVWVGEGNHYTEGISKNLWGTSTSIEGITYDWGMPMWWLTNAGAPRREAFAQNNHKNFGWNNSFRFGPQLTANMQWTANYGQVIVDHYWTRVSELGNPKHEQGGKPDELKKPARAHFGNDGPGGHYHKQQADLLKLRTLALNYSVNSDQLARIGLRGIGMQGLTIGIAGRDLININNCACPDAEGTYRFEDDTEGTGNTRNWNIGRSYPSSATFSAEIGVTF